MESIASTSSNHHHRRRRSLTPTQPLADRIFRALSHHLRLLHRRDATFYVLGATCNVYIVTISTTPSCTCPDRTTPCKHILFVLIRVLSVSIDDTCLHRRRLRPCHLQRLLSLPISTEALATQNVREMFHQLSSQQPKTSSSVTIKVENGTTCPVCLEEMNEEEKIAACVTCRNPIHEECLMAWKRSNNRRKSINCVLCRARWRDVRNELDGDNNKYLNLSPYIISNDADNETDENHQNHCRDN
ncbi:mitogen-activated protein kinase kinase kinase 1 [Capsicum galapagoense]